jgi:hypothetical protein
MGYEEVTSLDADVVVALGKRDKKTGKEYPKQAEGYYLGNRTVQNKRGESLIHFLKTPKGNLGLWGTTDLNKKLSQIAAGTMVRVTSTGTKPTPNGDMYTYKVEADKSNTIEVSVASAEAADDSGSDETAYEAGSSYEGDGDAASDEDGDDNEAVYAAAAVSAAERKAKVEALLRGAKSKTK